jgi:ankyrin repeat protein
MTILLFQSNGLGGDQVCWVKLVEFLIKEGVDVNSQSHGGETPFWCCAKCGPIKLLKMLVEQGANPNISRITDGATALHMAAQNGNIDICRYLVEECGLDVNAISSHEIQSQTTPLFDAAGDGQLDVCKYLIGKGALVDAGYQPLTSAAMVYLLIIIPRMVICKFANIF